MTKAQEMELLPCPFCGGTNIKALAHLDWVACDDCGASLEDVEPSARELWNTRLAAQSADAKPKGEDDAMTKATEEMLALADKIEYAIKTEGEITLFETNGTRIVYVLRSLAAQSAGEPPTAREPDAWQYRFNVAGWLPWHEVDMPLDRFCEQHQFNLDNGTLEMRPLYAALSVPPGDQARGWQPIETAPKDKAVLLYGPQVSGSRDDMAGWDGNIVASGYYDGIDTSWCVTGSTWRGPFIAATHWQPLPTPPLEVKKP